MLIIWGFKKVVHTLGKSFVTKECEQCHQTVTLSIVKVQNKLTIFWIPLFTTSTTYFLVCPVCQQGMEISKQEAEEYLVESIDIKKNNI